MKRRISRKCDFTTTDVRDALIAWLASKDIQYPKDYSSLTYELTEDGASLEWSEEIED